MSSAESAIETDARTTSLRRRASLVGGVAPVIIAVVGPAIQVTRSSGRKFVVTVDDADTGAAVLAALLPAPR